METDQLRLADPHLAVELLGTLRQDGDALIDELDDPESAPAWAEHAGFHALGATGMAELQQFRNELRVLLTAVVTGARPDGATLDALNQAAADAPLTLEARLAEDSTITVARTSPARSHAVARADIARAALALLTDPARSQLRLCDAPNCVRFFLKQHPRQQWCTPACGNRARVARHYARRHDPKG